LHQDSSGCDISQQAAAQIQFVFENRLTDTVNVEEFVQKVSAVAGDIKKGFYSPPTFTVQFIFDCSAECAEFQTEVSLGVAIDWRSENLL
jgi:hypothetical protein